MQRLNTSTNFSRNSFDYEQGFNLDENNFWIGLFSFFASNFYFLKFLFSILLIKPPFLFITLKFKKFKFA